MCRGRPRALCMFSLVLAVGALFGGCGENGLLNPDDDGNAARVQFRAAPADAGIVRLMTQNLYVGAAIEDLFDSDLPLPVAAWQLWQRVQATDFPERAHAIADKIARYDPHLIGLNEVSFFEIVPLANPAGTETLFFLDELLNALGDRGLVYDPVSMVQNFEGQVPMVNPGTGEQFLATLVDFDVVLAKRGVEILDWDAARYDAVAVEEVEIPGIPFPIPIPLWRGWASVDARVEGLTFRFVATHLEPGEDYPEIQEAQGDELIEILNQEGLPHIAVGDFNSAADGSTTPTYSNFIGAGFEDGWGKRGEGHTCCQEGDLLNHQSILDRRFDLILLRGDFGLEEPGVRGAVHATIFGNKVGDKTPSGLWPSDHAGVAARMKLPRRAD